MKKALKSSTAGLAAERGKRRRNPAKHSGPVTGQHLLQVMEKHDRPFAMLDSLMADDAPAWVKVLAKKWFRHQYPGVPLGPDTETDPAFSGAQAAKGAVARMLGHGEIELTERVQRDLQKLATRLTKAAVREATQRLEGEIADQASYVDEVMPLVTRMREPEQERFMRAYNKTLKLGIQQLDPTRVPVEEKIVQILLFRWRWIARLQTVSQVHQFLEAVFAKDGVIISRARVAQFCRRIGLRFRGPGRPRKSENTTKAP